MVANVTSSPRAGAERVDARDKVRGRTRYAADHVPDGLLHGALVPSRIARGRVTRIDTAAAADVPGVRLILTHDNIGPLPIPGPGFSVFQALRGTDIIYRGQTVALVIAETLQAAIEAAALVDVRYVSDVDDTHKPLVATIHAPGATAVPQSSLLPLPMFADKSVGDADAVLAASDIVIDATYDLPKQHQNPIELIATVATWHDGSLVLQEPTQNAENLKHGLAKVLAIDPACVRVVSPTIGGAFGQKNGVQPHTALVAIAARLLDRPVKVVIPRTQLFHVATYRPAGIQRVRLGADRSGRIHAAIHEVEQQTSRYEAFPSFGADLTSRLYGIENFRGADRLVPTDVQTPGYMRAPNDHPAAFAFESTIDELAYALGQDPLALRLANDTQTDALTGKPFSSRHLAECLTRGAERFGWSRRSMAPGSMRADDGSLIGWGLAIGAYKAGTAPAVATVRLERDGRVRASVGAHEMGQGIRTAIALTLVRVLGVDIHDIDIQIGDTDAAPQHITAGSWGTATVVPPIEGAAVELVNRLRRDAGADATGTALELLVKSGMPFVEAECRMLAAGQTDDAFTRLTSGLPAVVGPVYPTFIAYSFIAHFVEVRVEPTTRRITVPRVVSVVDCGTVVSPRTARSQVEGGVVWGIGAALREVGEVDPRHGGCLNADMAEYVITVAADIGRIEVEFIDRPDPLINPQGVKGLGEVSMVGVAGAIANAVFHATGRRMRKLPIRIDDMI